MTTIKRFYYESASAKLVVLDNGLVELKDVWSDIRGQGHAKGLLMEIVDFADQNNLTILLIAAPYGRIRDKPYLDERDLEWFYHKFGFKVQSRRPTRMRRDPGGCYMRLLKGVALSGWVMLLIIFIYEWLNRRK